MIDWTGRWIGLPLVLCLLGGGALADSATLVTFGPEAAPVKGDDDHQEVVYLRVPKGAPDPLYLHVFDPDVGGTLDEPTNDWNTRTRFVVMGAAAPDGSDAKPLAEASFGESAETDAAWHRLAQLSPTQGEPQEDAYLFRVEVRGLEGDDGNLFDLELSAAPDAQTPVPGVERFAYRPAISIPPLPAKVAEARVDVPVGTRRLHLRAFDLDRAATRLERPFAEPLVFPPSSDGAWREVSVHLDETATPTAAALSIRGGSSMRNVVVLEAADQDGRPLAVSLPVRMESPKIAPRPALRYEYAPDCRGALFDASASVGQGAALSRFDWDFGDGHRGQGQRVEHRYAEPGTYGVELRVVDDSGRPLDRARVSQTIKLNRLPEPKLDAPRVAAPGERISLSGVRSRDQDGRLTAYLWDLGDGARARGPTATHVYRAPGRYQVKLLTQDDGPGPCTSAEALAEVWINAAPLAEAGPDQRAAIGEPVRFDAAASRDSDGGIRRYLWDFGVGQRAEGQTLEHGYGAAGRYQVTLTLEDDAGVANSRAEDSLLVQVNAPPLARAKGAERGAVGESLTFDAAGSQDPDGALTQYQWDFGDGGQATGVQVAHAYAQPGTYEVRLRVRDDSGTRSQDAETALKVVINAPPVAEAGPDQWVTASEVLFDGSASSDPDGAIRSWIWDFGDGGQGEGPRPRHVFASPGAYRVSLRVTDDSGTATASTEDSLLVRINAKPLADAGPDVLAVPGQPIAFDGRGSRDPDGQIADYRWDFGDGATAVGAQASHGYAEPGLYSVGLEVRDDSGHPEAQGLGGLVVRINAAPLAVAGPDRRLAPGETLVLDAGDSHDPDGRIQSYRWRFDHLHAPLEGVRASLSFATPGVYPGLLEVTDDSGAGNGRAEAPFSVRVNHPPTAVPGPAVHQCAARLVLDGRASQDPDGDRLSYRWTFGDGTESEPGALVSHLFPGPGLYPVELQVDDGTGLANARASAATQVRVHRPPQAVAEGPSLVCAGDTLVFYGAGSRSGDGAPLLYQWDFGDGTSAQIPSPTKRFEQGGQYQVTLWVRDDSGLDCDQDQDRIALTVVDAPVAEAGKDLSVCANSPLSFDGTASRDFDGVVNSYSWDFGDGTQGGGARPTHVYAQAGDYLATLTITGDRLGDCDNRNTDRLRVKVLEAPRVAVSGPTEAAVDAAVRLAAMPLETDAGELDPGLAFRWDFGDGAAGEGREIEHHYAVPGRYQAKLSVDDGRGGECSQTQVGHAIRINAPPVAVAGDDRQIALGERALFDASASHDPDGVIARYYWDFGDGSAAEGPVAAHVYAEPGTYSVRLSVRDATQLPNREQSDTLVVRVSAPPVPKVQVTPERPCPGAPVELDGSGSRGAGGRLGRWVWSFGDGAGAEGERSSHVYAAPGRYALSLEVTDDGGPGRATATLWREIQVNSAPSAKVRLPLRACPDEAIGFDGSASVDLDGRIQALSWSFGDGTEAPGATASHAYSSPGRYPVELRVTDDSGSACAQASVRAEARVNARPKARISASSKQAYLDGAHDLIRLDASGSSDPEGGPLTYAWDLGDGTRARGVRIDHGYARPGRYRVTLSVRDDSGTACAEATDSLEIQALYRASPDAGR